MLISSLGIALNTKLVPPATKVKTVNHTAIFFQKKERFKIKLHQVIHEISDYFEQIRHSFLLTELMLNLYLIESYNKIYLFESMKPTILYVDDEIINLELFKINFEGNYEVIAADSGAKALSILKKNKDIPVIVSDLKMPGMNGMELIAEIKNKYPGKVCIMLTAFADTDVMMRAINEELIFRYMLKPWNRDELIKTIDLAIDRNEKGLG